MKKVIGITLLLAIILLAVLIFSLRPKKIKPAVPAVKGRIAIVLDDWGYNRVDLDMVEEIKYPLTLAILPNISYSRQAAEELASRGFEIILHLPMEPQEKYGLEKNTVMVSLDKARILEILNKDLASVPYAKGVSNHMGSRATSDSKTMEIIFGELKKKGLYFLDSFVTAKSVCSRQARKMHLVCFRRDVFLDNKQEPNYIKRQLNQLKLKARAQGFAVGIGHDHKITLEVLKEALPQLSKEGYKLVYLSELRE